MQTEALFENIADRIEQELTQAEQSIYIAVAWFTNPRLFDVLLTKAKQGITVQLLISNDPINQQSPIDYSGLNIGNSVAYFIGEGKDDLMHNKFCVIDEYTVINGSYNWSKKAERNHENIIITTGDSVLAQSFIKQFKKIRNSYFDHQDHIPDLPLDKIIKRLEILKNYVILEDLDDITRETAKLQVFSFQQDINQITHALQLHQFSTAIGLINDFIKNHQAIIVYNDIDLTALKLEIRQIEHQLNAYDNEKIEIEKLLSEFHYRHTKELGWYISRLLHLRKLLSQDDPEKYAEAVQDEKEYHEQVEAENEKTIYEIDEEQRKELKKSYRKASQICHPDRVCEDMKDVAEELFIQLNQAYEQNDIATVNKILAELEQGIFAPRSETVSEKSQLQGIITQLKFKIAQIETEIFEMKDSKVYQTIIEIDDWNRYFDDTREQLIDEIDRLEQKLNEPLDFQNDLSDDIPF